MFSASPILAAVRIIVRPSSSGNSSLNMVIPLPFLRQREKRDEVASPRLFVSRARINGYEDRGPISERARLIVDVGADRGFAAPPAVGRARLTVAGAAAGSIAATVRHERDVVRDDLGG